MTSKSFAPSGYEVAPTKTSPTTATYYGVKYCDSFESALNTANADGIGEIFVNGGESVYKTALEMYPEYCKKVFVEEMNFSTKFDSDTFFQNFQKSLKKLMILSLIKKQTKLQLFK